jgi:hypothetical protein
LKQTLKKLRAVDGLKRPMNRRLALTTTVKPHRISWGIRWFI